MNEYAYQVGCLGRGDFDVPKNKGGGGSWAVTFINQDSQSILKEFALLLKALPKDRVTPLPVQIKNLINE